MSDRDEDSGLYYGNGGYEGIPGGIMRRRKRRPEQGFDIDSNKPRGKTILPTDPAGKAELRQTMGSSSNDDKKYALQRVKGRWVYSK